jgi:hypothetical protein
MPMVFNNKEQRNITISQIRYSTQQRTEKTIKYESIFNAIQNREKQQHYTSLFNTIQNNKKRNNMTKTIEYGTTNRKGNRSCGQLARLYRIRSGRVTQNPTFNAHLTICCNQRTDPGHGTKCRIIP